jgi:hypothetical protein
MTDGSYTEEILKKVNALPPLERQNAIERLKRYQSGTASERDEKFLAELGVISKKEPVNDTLPNCDSQKALAAILTRHFSGRCPIDISEVRIAQWKSGRGLHGAPLPPAKIGHRLSSKAWAEWFEAYILPKVMRKSGGALKNGKDIFQQGEEAEAEEKMERLKITRIERKVAEGQWQAVDVYLRGLRDVGAISNQKLNAMETLIADHIAAAIGADDWKKIGEPVRAACRIVIDAIRADLASALRNAGHSAIKK